MNFSSKEPVQVAYQVNHELAYGLVCFRSYEFHTSFYLIFIYLGRRHAETGAQTVYDRKSIEREPF